MRTLAEFSKGDRGDEDAKSNFALVEILAAQVVAKAAYDGERLTSLVEIKAAVDQVAGYPMLNRVSGPSRPKSDVGTEAAYRVADLIGLHVE
jgi:hypothetical protein